MIYTTAQEIIILYTGDGGAVVHMTKDGVGIPTTAQIVSQWQDSLGMLIEAQSTPALKSAIEQTELLYGLCGR